MWQERNGEDTGLGWEWGYIGVSGEPACKLHSEGGEWVPACRPGDDTPVRITVNMVFYLGVGSPTLGNRKWLHLLCDVS